MENNQVAGRRVLAWDGWRGLAIVLVLLGHFVNIKGFWELRLGVDVFFVLSGMLMSSILFEKRMPLKNFYIRRFSRIFPVFFLFVIVIYALAWVAGNQFGQGGFDFKGSEVVSTLAFLRTYFPLDPHIWTTKIPIGHLWSLNVEEHAYVIMSILTLFFIRNKNAAIFLILLGALSVGIGFYYYANYDVATDPREVFRIRTESAVSFIFLSAGYNLLRKKYQIVAPSLMPVVTLILAFACYLSVAPDWLTFSVAPILLAFTINHLNEAHGLLQRFLELKFLRMLGIWSYSIYIWQQPFYIYKSYVPGGSYVALSIAIIVGVLSYYLFENPVRNWINKRWTKPSLI